MPFMTRETLRAAGRRLALAAILGLSCLTARAGTPPADTPPGPKYAPTDQYDVQRIEGWRVLVYKGLQRDEPEICQRALKVLGHQLYDITRRVPAEAVEKLRQVPVWVELNESHHACMAYHPDAGWLRAHDMNPEKAGCVEIANARNFLSWTLEQPYMVLHEMAHGYHDRFLPGGYGNPEIRAAYERAKEAKLYESVLRRGQKRERAYAMNNPMEYFAETTEAYFGTNDFYPFVHVELREHDAKMHELLTEVWGVARRAKAR